MRFDRITIEPGKMGGQPCIRGYRLTVKRVVSTLAVLGTREAVLEAYPELEPEDIGQALAFAAALLPGGELEVREPLPGLAA